jgi:cytochrome P450
MNDSKQFDMPCSVPGPGECLPDIGGDWLEYMARSARAHGSVVRLTMPRPLNELILVTDPMEIERIFIDDAAGFKKPRSQRVLTPILGTGLLLGEGDPWKQHRRIVQPAFHRTKIVSYAEEMAASARAMVDSWEHATERDLFADASKLTFRVAVGTLFGATFGPETDRIRAALGEALLATDDFLDWRRMQRAGGELKAAVDEFIAERRRSGEDRGDILSMLLHAKDEEGASLSDREVRDEVINAFVGGVDTTAIAISWTLSLLARHPDVAERLRGEIAEVVGERSVGLQHIGLLKFTDRVIKENLRLYPPAWAIARETVSEVQIRGFRVAPGTQVYTCPYLVHRNPSYFHDPENFSPDRWTDDLIKQLPRFAYFPFGGGQRMCIGAAFASMELVLVLATIVQRVRFELTDRLPEPRPSFTLRPRDGLHLRVLFQSS